MQPTEVPSAAQTAQAGTAFAADGGQLAVGRGAEFEKFLHHLENQCGTINHCQRLYLPFTIHHERLADNRRMANFFTCQPISATRSRRYMWVTRTGQFDAPIEESQAITDLIREQDELIVQAQRPEELPIDLSAELHLHGSDAVAVAYRRHLAAFAIE